MYRYKRRLPLVLLGLVLLTAITSELLFPNPSEAKSSSTPGCLAADSLAIDLKDELVELMGRTDAMADTILAVEGIARVATTQIAIVTDPTTCERAANAYSNSVGIPDANRMVHAIRAGLRYLVMDPNYKNGPNKVGITFDSSFTQAMASFMY